MTLDRQAQCPSCGAPMAFKLGVRAQVCAYCRFVVVRTDRGLEKHGKVADLLELPSPFVVGGGGFWNGKRFEVEGRAQYDRADQASAPWQEFLLGFPEDGTYAWVASAQGRWYVTYEVPHVEVPPYRSLSPGTSVSFGAHGRYTVQEVGGRRLRSAAGNLTGIPRPDERSVFADVSGPDGRFGTIDYGSPEGDRPVVYLGQQFDPAGVRLDSGVLLDAPSAAVKEVQCPRCGGNLPLISGQVERIVCPYCGTASDLNQGVLTALGPVPRSTRDPKIAIGAEGTLRGMAVTFCGFVARSCLVDGQRYTWDEYLLWAGPSAGYWWLMEDEGQWWLVTPVEVGEVDDHGHRVRYRGEIFSETQSVRARVDHVVGEFYWKVAIGETVEATEFGGANGKVSRERSEAEVVYSFCGRVHPRELVPFGLAPTSALDSPAEAANLGCTAIIVVAVLLALAVAASAVLDDCGDDGFGGPSIGGGYYSK